MAVLTQPNATAFATHNYYTFTPLNGPPGLPRPLKADEYRPEDIPVGTKYPAMVLVHGGRWTGGCRQVVGGVARLFTGVEADIPPGGSRVAQQFIVLAIDYRLACPVGTYPDAVTSALPYLCGWDWTKVDPRGYAQASVQDVKEAIKWVRSTLGPAHAGIWNQQVAALGVSAGGNLVAQVAADSTVGADFAPDAAAILSGFPETDTLNPPNPPDAYGCDEGYSNNPQGCWMGINIYLGCPSGVPAETTYAWTTSWAVLTDTRGPRRWMGSTTPPPTPPSSSATPGARL